MESTAGQLITISDAFSIEPKNRFFRRCHHFPSNHQIQNIWDTLLWFQRWFWVMYNKLQSSVWSGGTSAVLPELHREGKVHLYGPLTSGVVGVTLQQQVALLFADHSSTL